MSLYLSVARRWKEQHMHHLGKLGKRDALGTWTNTITPANINAVCV